MFSFEETEPHFDSENSFRRYPLEDDIQASVVSFSAPQSKEQFIFGFCNTMSNMTNVPRIENVDETGEPPLKKAKVASSKVRISEDKSQEALQLLKEIHARGTDETTKELLATIKNQESHIKELINHVLPLNFEYRQSVIEQNKQLKKELEEKNTLLASRNESKLKERITELENLATERKRQLEEANKRFTQLNNELLSLKTHSRKELTVSTEKVKAESEEAKSVPNGLYTWAVVETQSIKCKELYGYKSSEILRLYAQVSEIMKTRQEERNKRGCKMTVSEETVFLIFLYFFRHYHTMRIMQEKFCISSSDVQTRLLKMITSVSHELFRASHKEESLLSNKSLRVYRCYFMTINKPLDTAMSQKYYSPLYKQHGLYIHCIHHTDASGKVIAFTANTKKNVNKEWLKSFIDGNNNDVADDDDADDGTYETRMKNKFAIMAIKYRGNVTELYNIIECLLALTNFDIQFGNPIEDRSTQIELEDD